MLIALVDVWNLCEQEDMHQIIRILPKQRQTMLFSATQVRIAHTQSRAPGIV
jgi:superfamily II DNA/RNA helicase